MSLSPLPTWVLVLLSLAVFVAVIVSVIAFRKEERSARRRLRGLVCLRFLAAVAIVLLLLEPGKRLLQTTRVKNRVVFLLDRSASMGFPVGEGDKRSRAQALAALLSHSAGALAKLSERFTLEFLAFDGGITSLESTEYTKQLEPSGGTTDILGGIRAAAQGAGAAAGRKLSGIVVISDGADNVELEEGVGSSSSRMLKGLGIPISTVAIGSGRIRDLAVEKIVADDFSFVRNSVQVTAILRAHGLGTVEVPVVLKREGQVIATQKAKIGEQDASQIVFSFAPDQTGNLLYSIEAPVLAGETVTANNAQAFSLRVIRDRVRVLMVVGRPSWDVRFLRGLLKQDPNVDLVSFFILRGPNDNPRVVSDDELSLIPFPVREIFHEQLRSFDVIIMQNFAYAETAYQMTQYLRGIADYVREGGALVMVGGENSFGEGKYELTELQAVLPVEPTGLPPSAERFRARLTNDGLRHPVAAVAASSEESADAWAKLPELDGVHVTRAKGGSHVLLEHPFLTVGNANVPVIVLGEQGRGRVLAVLTDSLWNWSFGAYGSGSSQVYDKFWSNAIRWLVRDPELSAVKVVVAKPSVEMSEPIAVTASAKLKDFRPAIGARIELELVRSGDGGVVARQEATSGLEGIVRSQMVAPEPGAYKVVARANHEGVVLGEAEDVVAVKASGAELTNVASRPEVLRQIAQVTGGAYQEGTDELDAPPLKEPRRVEVGRRKDVRLWNRWYFLTIVGVSLGAEWLLRRRWGFA